MSDYLSSLGYPFRGRPMVFVFSVMMVWGVFLAARDVLIGWIAAFCFLLPFAVYAHTAAWAADTTLAWLFLAAGVIYFPGVFMRTSVRERFSGLSPVGWWGLVRRAPFSYAGLLGAICAGGWIILNLPSGPLMDFAMVPVKLYVACVLMNMCGLFMLKHEFAGEEEDGSFSPSGPAAS